MDKIERGVFRGLFVVLILLAGLFAATYSALPKKSSQSTEPFIKDRVVTVRIVIDEKAWQRILANPRAKEYERADFWFDGQKYPNVAIRAKGNSSLMSIANSGTPRMSLKVDFNFFNFAQTFRGLKKLCLNNGFSDVTLIKETLGYEIFDQMGFPTPRTAFVDLYINDQHLGVYTQVEPIDKTFLKRHFQNPNGNLYKPEIGAATLNWTKADLDEQLKNMPESSQSTQNNNMSLNIGGARLSDLLKLMQRESPSYDPNQVAGDPRGFGGPGGGFPGGPGGPFGRDPNGFRGRGGFGFGPGGQGGGFPGGPGGPFPQDANGFGPGGGGFGFDQGGPFPDGPGGGFPEGPGGPGGPFPQDANGFGPEGGGFGFDQGGQFPGGPGGRFQGGPGGPGGGFGGPGGGPGGFGGGPGGRGPGGPGGPFGRGGNLLEVMGLRTNENYQDHTALFHFLDVLNNCPNDTFPTEIEKVLDVDQVLKYFAVSVLTVHLDNYMGLCHNYYLYENDGKFTILPWDLNMVFGGFNMGQFGGDASDYQIDQLSTLTDRPLACRLLAYKPYLDKYHQYLEQMLSGCFAEGVIEARVDKYADLIRPYVEADPTKSFTMEDFEKGLNEGVERGGMMGGPPGMGFQRNMRFPQDANGVQPGGGGFQGGPGGQFGRDPNGFQARGGGFGFGPDRQGGPGPQDANAPPQDFQRDMRRQGDMQASNQRGQRFGAQGQNGGQNRQNRRGFGGRGNRGGPGGGGPPGMGGPGIKSFLTKRRQSVRKQLDGEIPSKTDTQYQGGGFGGPMMPGMGARR